MRAILSLIFAAAVIVGCAHAGAVQLLFEQATQRGIKSHTTSPVQHVIIIIQENRTFDNRFNGFSGADSAQSVLNREAEINCRLPVLSGSAATGLRETVIAGA